MSPPNTALQPADNPSEYTGLKPVTKRNSRTKLRTLMRHDKESYRGFLNHLRLGAWWWSAAAAIGVHRDTLSGWLLQGEADRLAGKSSDYSRLYDDVYAAVGEARTVREVVHAAEDSKHWLAVGPGRLIGDEWRPSSHEGTPGVTVNILNSNQNVQADTEEEDDDALPYDGRVPVQSGDVKDALRELEHAGYLTFTGSTPATPLDEPTPSDVIDAEFTVSSGPSGNPSSTGTPPAPGLLERVLSNMAGPAQG